jgi:hypothetical protein
VALAAFAAGALLGGILSARHSAHRARLFSVAVAVQAAFLATGTVLTLTITGVAADSALAGGTGSKAGRRLTAVVTMLAGALIGAVLVRHAPIWLPLGIAFAVTVAGALTAYGSGKSDPPWVRAQA